MNLQENFEMLADPEMWTDVAAIGAGYMGSTVAQSILEGRMPFDAPNELYGAGVAFGGFYVDAEYSNKVAMGGGLYTLDAFAQRVGLKSTVTNLGGN